jgi:hypothetical protein
VFGILILGAITLVFLESIWFLCTIGMLRRGTAAKGSRGGELAWLAQAMGWLVLGSEYFIATLIAVLGGYLPVHARAGEMPRSMLIFLFGSVILSFVAIGLFLAWLMRRTVEMRKAEKLAAAGRSPTDAPQGDRTEDKYWKCGGMFYYNPDDPAIWVEKRMGIGWTTNMARGAAWAILGAFLLLTLLFLVVTFWIAGSVR